MDHISDSGITLNDNNSDTVGRCVPLTAHYSTFSLTSSQYSKAANQKTILNKVVILPEKKIIIVNYFSIPPQMPTKMFIILLDLNFKVTILLLS